MQTKLAGAAYEADAADIDVHALHQGFLRGARAGAAKLVCDAEVQALAYHAQAWEVTTTQGRFSAPLLINAAGAWADVIGQMAGADRIGLVPKRRSAFIFSPPAGTDVSSWPCHARCTAAEPCLGRFATLRRRRQLRCRF